MPYGGGDGESCKRTMRHAIITTLRRWATDCCGLYTVHYTLKEPLYTQNIATLLQHMLRIHLHNPGTYLRADMAGAGQCIAT
jgi:hypothetical protein